MNYFLPGPYQEAVRKTGPTSGTTMTCGLYIVMVILRIARVTTAVGYHHTSIYG